MNIKEYKIILAKNIDASPEKLTELLRDSDSDVRYAACSNPNITDEALNSVSKDSDEMIRITSALILLDRAQKRANPL